MSIGIGIFFTDTRYRYSGVFFEFLGEISFFPVNFWDFFLRKTSYLSDFTARNEAVLCKWFF